MSVNEKVTILINSCEAFSDMWENIVHLYDKYWAEHPRLILLSDKHKGDLFNDYLLCFDEEMSDRLINAVKSIKTDYIFLSFDDYYPKNPINSGLFADLIEEIEKQNIDYCRLYNKPKCRVKKDKNFGYRFLSLTNYYEVNFYPSIWKKEALLKILKSNEEIWKSEARLTRRAREASLNCITRTNKGLFEFVDIVRKGKYLRSAYRYLKRNNLYISDRKVRTISETIRLNIRTFISENTPKPLKDIMKKVFSKKEKKFYSDYADTDD